MSGLRRRDLLALAAVPLGCMAQAPAFEKPKQKPDSKPPASPDRSSNEELLGAEIPKGKFPPLASGPYQGLRWKIRLCVR